VSAKNVEPDDTRKTVRVTHGAIINGAQTQGEIRRFTEKIQEAGEEISEFHARVEFLVDPDEDFKVDAAVARNTSTNVQRNSQAGKKYFEDLNASFQESFSQYELSRSETDMEDNFVDTQRVLQILWAMIPERLLPKSKKFPEARLKSYKNKANCLVDFEQDFLAKDNDAGVAERDQYFVDLVGDGWREYLKWRPHKEWRGTRLREKTRAVRRHGKRLTVADGVIIPILSAMSLFVEQGGAKGQWVLKKPRLFNGDEMIEAARDQLTAPYGNPVLMGRNTGVYETLALLPNTVLRFTKCVPSEG
jgi:hypothetical protein